MIERTDLKERLGYLFFWLPVFPDGPPNNSPMDMWYLLMCFDVDEETIGKLVPHLQTGNCISFAELVWYHDPHNAEALLGYGERTRALVDANYPRRTTV